MTSSNLRDLLDKATSDIPVSVAQPPLTAIRARVSRRRTIFATAGAVAAIAVVLAVTIPLHVWKAKPAPAPPAAAPAGITWEFGFADGNKLTVYATTLRKCTFLNNPVATAQRAGDPYTIRLTGELDTISGCPTPDTNGVSRTQLAQATVQLDQTVPTALIKDVVSGQIRPIYDRKELPIGFASGTAHGSSWGAQSRNGDPAEFRGSFQSQKEISPPSGFLNIEFRGLGLSTVPPQTADGEAATFGSINGWLAPGADGKSYRFVWHKPRGDSWITYELFAPGTKAAFISLLQQLTWP